MKLTKKIIKRLGIVVFYDRDGMVDDYVLFMLESLKEATEEIIIVSNSALNEEEQKKLAKFTNKLKIRENRGLDAGAFKEVYLEYQNYIKSFDELVLLNDTFYGPFLPFKDIVKTMEEKDIDFWGLTANYESPNGFENLSDKSIASHIQTFFIAFRNNVLNSEAFNQYWEKYDIKKMQTFENVVTKHEITFTHYLEKAGYKWDIYTNLEKYHSKHIEENYNYYAYASYDLIKNYNCPFIKRKNFVFEKKDAFYLTNGDDTKKSLEYLEKNHLYNTNLIWKNITRLYTPWEIYYGLNLNYIVQEKKVSSISYTILLILENEKYFSYYSDFILANDDLNIQVMTTNKKIKKELEKIKIKQTSKETFNWKNYQYIGIIKDDYFYNIPIPLVYENNWNAIKQNGFANLDYINGILDLFKRKVYLGMLILPVCYHGEYFSIHSKPETTIPANENACWIKSELFNWKLIEQKDFIQKYMKDLDNKNLVVAKIHNENEIDTQLTNSEYVIHKTFKQLKENHIIGMTLNDYLYNIKHAICLIQGKNSMRVYLIKLTKKLHIYNFLKKIKSSLQKKSKKD